MSVINDLINIESDSLDFGNYELATKTKKDGIEFSDDVIAYICKFVNNNGMFVYESVPGTAVHGFRSSEEDVSFIVEGTETSSITLELEPETDYKIHIDDIYVGKNKTNLGGKLSISVDLEPGREVKVDVRKAFD